MTALNHGQTTTAFSQDDAKQAVAEIERLRLRVQYAADEIERLNLLVQHANDVADAAAADNARLQADKAELLAACKWLEPYARVQVERHPNNADSQNWQKLLDAIKNAEVHK